MPTRHAGLPRLRRCLGGLGAGIAADVSARSKTYADDWRDARDAKLRVLAATVFIFLASALPALAFGVQLSDETDGTLTVAHVLAATAAGGVVQAVLGGQPLLIVGVAEPIVLVYKYMYDYAKDADGLGAGLFLPWAAWACVWAGAACVALALSGACSYISRFTRFAGESFGALIALLFLQQAIKGCVDEFRTPDTDDVDPTLWRTVNGLWALFLAWGLLLTAILTRTARKWRFMNAFWRAVLADYGAPLALAAWTGLSYAVSGPPGVPSRVESPSVWDVTGTWGVAARLGDVPGRHVASALLPGAIIAVLFFFDHNVSAQLAQQPEFNLRRAAAYHWDMLLLGLVTATFGLVGLPPINGVIPQSPMHTKALSTVRGRVRPRSLAKKTSSQADLTAGDGQEGSAARPTSDDAGATVVLEVAEQRVSNLGQALLVGAMMAAMAAVRCIPTAALWGYFAFMALESLPGSQLWERTALLATDPARRHWALQRGHAPYLETLPFRTVAAFTGVQLACVGVVYGLTWAGVAGVLFPLLIMALVPLRAALLPRFFSEEALDALDAMQEEAAPPLEPGRALAAAAAQGMAPRASLEVQPPGDGILESEEVLDDEIQRFRVVHHLSEQELAQRRAGARAADSGLPGDDAA